MDSHRRSRELIIIALLLGNFAILLWSSLFLGERMTKIIYEYRGYRAEAKKAIHYGIITNGWMVNGR